jgi:uncharacterized membrane protein YqjE
VAIFSVLLSFIGKKIGTIVQAIFGWSVTALFGRLPKKKQMAVTVALILSIAWPIFLLGLFLPGVSGWLLAILPLEKWLGATVLRIVWAALALFAPPIVGLLTHWAAPSRKVGAAKSMLWGYPLALGYFLSFVITVVTVPVVKVASILKGWTDTHVYVQPREGQYNDVLRELCEACARAGLLPEVEDPPTRMMLATKVLKKLAKGMVSPIVAEEIKVVRAKNVEMYLYPADLLIRGKEQEVALVRAMMMRTDLDADAYLVGSEKGQCIQDELGRLIDVIRSHEQDGEHAGRTATSRLIAIWHEMNESKLPFDEWVLLESIARRVERRIAERHAGVGTLPLDHQEDGLPEVEREANGALTKQTQRAITQEKTMSMNQPPPERLPLEQASTVDLVKEALDEAKELVRLEVEIAKDEVKQEVAQTKKAAIGFGVALAFALVVLSLLAVAIVLAVGGTAGAALAVAAVFLVLGGIAGYVGYSMIPKKPLDKTLSRVKRDVNQLKEHIA